MEQTVYAAAEVSCMSCSLYEILAPLARIMTSGIQDREGDRNVGNGANSSRPAPRFARPRLPPGAGARPTVAILPAGPTSCQRHLPEGCLRHLKTPCRSAWPMGGPPAEGFPSLVTAAAPAFPGPRPRSWVASENAVRGAKWGRRSFRSRDSRGEAAASGPQRVRGIGK
jgi:hypothetical protein